MTRRIFLMLLLCAAAVSASDRYIDVAEFKGGKGSLVINVEINATGDRKGHLYVRDGAGHGSGMWFTRKEWQDFSSQTTAAMTAARGLTVGQTRAVGNVHTGNGSSMRVEALKPTRKPMLRLTYLAGKGDSYPPVPFELDATDFTAFQGALASVAKQI